MLNISFAFINILKQHAREYIACDWESFSQSNEQCIVGRIFYLTLLLIFSF